ncbi:hypothetical protein ABZ446_18065 [Streptomyces sp. NPDC005813]|uniref:hypothetical protein n=1 Tax=Streptomyces sp. NPDC005813 TaxID=3155592 RepID=UPI0033F18C35
MNQRRDTYRAALQRGPEVIAPPRHTKVTEFRTRYVRVTIELDPDLPRDLTRWVRPPVAALLRAGAAALRPLSSTP